MASTIAQLRRQVRLKLPAPAERRALRLAAGLTLEEIAAVVGVTPQAVSFWELDERQPRRRHRAAYAKVLDALREEVAAADRSTGNGSRGV